MSVVLSVIIPVYNDQSHLRECLDSVLSQTLDGIEVICIDDGSTDGSLSVLQEYAAKYGNVVVLTQKNATASVARNRGLAQARGEYVAFCDSDDKYATPHSLADLYQAAKKYGVGAAGGSVLSFRLQRGDVWPKARRPADLAVGLHHYCDQPFDYNYQCFIFKREILLENDVRFPVISRFQDPPFMVRAMDAVDQFVMTDSEVYHYRWGHQAINWRKDNFNKMRAVFYGMADVVAFANRRGLRQVVDDNLQRLLKVYKVDFFRGEVPLEEMEEYVELLKAFQPEDRQKVLALRERIRKVPKVSIVIPSLNVVHYVRECMASVVGQTLVDIEIICVDAGSDDGTFEILREFEQKDSRLTLISSDQKSYGYQMNVGLRMARGEYVGIVEPDDYIATDMYETLYDVASTNQLDFVKSDLTRFCSKNGRKEFTRCPQTSNKSAYGKVVDTQADPTYLRLTLNNPTGIYRRKFLEEQRIQFNETPGASYQDVGFWLQTLLLARRAMFLDRSFYFYRSDNAASSVHSRGKVYCINSEYQFVLKWLSGHPELSQRFLPWVTWAKFASYNFALTRIADEFILEYVLRMYGVFSEDECAGALDRSLMNPYQRKRLDSLLSDPIGFAVSLQSSAVSKSLASAILNACQSTGGEAAKRRSVDGGKTWTREAKTVFARAMQCYCDNGIFYTIRRILMGRIK